MSGFEIRGTSAGEPVVLISPVSRSSHSTGGRNGSRPYRQDQVERQAREPETTDGFLAQLLAARHDLPQSRRRRRAAPEDGAGAYRNASILADDEPATISRLV